MQDKEREKKEEETLHTQFIYNQRNLHPRDANISFNKEGHIYTVNGKVLDSVTTIIENSFPKFAKERMARITAQKRGMTIEQVLALWEKEGRESRALGTLLHDKIEKYYQGNTITGDYTFDLFKKLDERLRLAPYRTEWAVYDYDLGIAGTIDFVDYQNNQYAIYDWKRSKKVVENGVPVTTNRYGGRGNHPIGNLHDTPYWHYALQLSIYKYILEHNYDIKISHLRLGIFHPTYTQPYLLEMPYLEHEVNAIVKLR